MNEASIACARISGATADFGSDRPKKYSHCARLALGQFWKGPDSLPSENAHVYIGAFGEGLCFYIYMQDGEIFSRATADNQKMWTLGDVAEFFVKPGDERSDYWEIHVTPNNLIMDIYIPDREKFMGSEIAWERVLAPNSHTKKRVHIGDGHWAVEACVPWQAFGAKGIPTQGTAWQIAVCRYNCTGGLENPELSSTAAFSQASFHRYEEYTQLVF
ncbi:MAG: hypothetical protein ACKVJG_01385 [Candidatus Latescibacterota bacterium]|jgi:hypothetical protein